jgi:hypothetical protein
MTRRGTRFDPSCLPGHCNAVAAGVIERDWAPESRRGLTQPMETSVGSAEGVHRLLHRPAAAARTVSLAGVGGEPQRHRGAALRAVHRVRSAFPEVGELPGGSSPPRRHLSKTDSGPPMHPLLHD